MKHSRDEFFFCLKICPSPGQTDFILSVPVKICWSNTENFPLTESLRLHTYAQDMNFDSCFKQTLSLLSIHVIISLLKFKIYFMLLFASHTLYLCLFLLSWAIAFYFIYFHSVWICHGLICPLSGICPCLCGSRGCRRSRQTRTNTQERKVQGAFIYNILFHLSHTHTCKPHACTHTQTCTHTHTHRVCKAVS